MAPKLSPVEHQIEQDLNLICKYVVRKINLSCKYEDNHFKAKPETPVNILAFLAELDG